MSGHRDPFRQETGLLVLFEECCQGYSPSETPVDGLPIWGMSVKDALPNDPSQTDEGLHRWMTGELGISE
jgi:hypothetical protein